tara:strand:+ start:384 stop:1082 length:699 start_codon:yes stop_codon:yes gene_type:complete
MSDADDDDICLEFAHNKIIFTKEFSIDNTIEYNLCPPKLDSNQIDTNKINYIFPNYTNSDNHNEYYLAAKPTKNTNSCDIGISMEPLSNFKSGLWNYLDDDIEKKCITPLNNTFRVQVEELTVISDKNEKKEIKKIDNIFNILNSINGYTYILKSSNRPSSGLIAQEVEKVIPSAVFTNNNIKSVNYNEVIPYLLEGIKFQEKLIENQIFRQKIIGVNLILTNILIGYLLLF